MTGTIARIRFRLPKDRRLDSDLSRLPFGQAELLTGFELIAGQENGPIGKSENIILRTVPLSSAEEAEKIGSLAEKALLFATTKIKSGVDLGKNSPKSMLTPFGLDTIRQKNELLNDHVMLNDFLGLTLVDASKPAAFIEFPPVQPIIGTPIENFIEAFFEGFQLAPLVTARSQLALELFSAARFEVSLRARFLILVSAIESITDRLPRAQDALDLISQMESLFNSTKINDADRGQMRGTFKDLKLRSIAGSSKDMIEQYCGKDKAKFFSKCYTARSDLVHTGRTNFDLGGHIQQLEELTSEAIIEFIRKNSR